MFITSVISCWSSSAALLALILFLSTNGYCRVAETSSSHHSDEDFAFDFNGDEDLVVEVTSADAASAPIRKLWGVPDDLTAAVGKIFRFVPPPDTFTTGVKYYELKPKKSKQLPNWIIFDRTDGSIRGVPLYSDAQQFSLILYAYRDSNDFASDEFTITVRYNDEYHNGLNCGKRNKTVLSIIFDDAIKDIKPKQRLIALENLAQFWGLDSSAFKLAGQYRNDRKIEEKSIILAGPGDKQSISKQQSAIQLTIGCNGQIDQNFTPFVTKLKEQSRDGTISEVTGLHTIGWKVAKEINTIRRRRDITTPEGGRAFSYYDENAEYELEEDDDDLDEGSTEVPEAIIPPAPATEATPELDESTHPHRHHHQLRPIDTSDDTYPKITPIVETFDIVTTPVVTTIKSTTVQHTPEATSTKIIPPTTEKEDNSVTEHIPTAETRKKVTEPSLDEDDDYDGGDDDDDDYDDENYDDDTVTEIPTSQTTSTAATSPIINIVTQQQTTKDVIITQPSVTESAIPAIIPTTTPYLSTVPEEELTSQSTVPLSSTSTVTTSLLPSSTSLPTIPTVESASTTPFIDSTLASTIISSTPSSTTTSTSPSPSPSTMLATLPPTTQVTEEETSPSSTYSSTTTSTPLPPTTEPEETTTVATVARTVPAITTNAAPFKKHRLPKLQWQAGVIHRFIIPNDTFGHPNNEPLFLRFLDTNLAPVKHTLWVQFNDKTNEIYGLPLEKHVSQWTFMIQAVDPNGATVDEILEITVQHHRGKRTVTHEFIMKLRIEDKYSLPKPLDWQMKVLGALKDVYHDKSLSNILVRSVDIESDPASFSWTNTSLPTNDCPKNEILALASILISDDDGTSSRAIQNLLAPEIRIKQIHYKGLEQCDGVLPTKANVSKNTIPVPRNQIDLINATVGELLVYKVPEDTFYDNEDGNTRKMKLSLFTMDDRQPVSPTHWLQFDEKNQEFYGIPFSSDKGHREYQLVCQDSSGSRAHDVLVIKVNPQRIRNPSVHFSMTLDIPYETFIRNARLQRKFVEKLAELFQDKDTSHIVIESITDSTIVSWVNKSLDTLVCPNDDINLLRHILMNDDDSITDRVTNIMNSDFVVEAVSLRPTGACLGGATIYHPDIPQPLPDDSRSSSPHASDDYLITIVLPGIIILTMLLLAGTVACVLIRQRRRSGKLNVGDEERRSLRTKGIPVIFQDELEDKPEPGNKTPIIMKEEKPPLPPPEYSKRGESPEEEALYQPPPPFPANRDSGRSVRPKATPTYRKPPPYVPP